MTDIAHMTGKELAEQLGIPREVAQCRIERARNGRRPDFLLERDRRRGPFTRRCLSETCTAVFRAEGLNDVLCPDCRGR